MSLLSVMIPNMFRKEQELLYQLEKSIRNLTKVRENSAYKAQLGEYTNTIKTIVDFSLAIDNAFRLSEENDDTYKYTEEIWTHVLNNRKVLEKAVEALKDLKHETDEVISMSHDIKE